MSENPLQPPWLNAPPVDPYPYEESHDLRVGPKLHRSLDGLLPYVGVWRGRGRGGFPTIEDFDFAQEIRISHDVRWAGGVRCWTATGSPTSWRRS
ncbi:hypothetical protein GCM10027452_26540 [Micromonospora halotolerans]